MVSVSSFTTSDKKIVKSAFKYQCFVTFCNAIKQERGRIIKFQSYFRPFKKSIVCKR